MDDAADTTVPDVSDVEDPTAGFDAADQQALADQDAAAYDEAIQLAGDDEVTTDARGNTVLAPGVDPQDVIQRAHGGAYWPAWMALPAEWADMSPDERADYLAGTDWHGAVDRYGNPAQGDAPWGVPWGTPGPGPHHEPGKAPAGKTRRGPSTAQTEADVKQAAKHGDTKTAPGGKGARQKRWPLGMRDPRGHGFGGGLRIVLFDLSGALSGWLSPKASISAPIASGNTARAGR